MEKRKMRTKIINVILIRFLTIFIISAFAVHLSVVSLDDNYENYITNQTTKKLNIGYLNYPDNYNLLCLITGCSNMIKKNPVTGLYSLYSAGNNYSIIVHDQYETINKTEYKNIPTLGTDYDLFLVNQNNLGFYKEKDYPFIYTKENIIILAGILFGLSLSIALILAWIDYYVKRFKFREDLLELNNELRGEITESLHHELGGPISVIETNTEYLLRHIQEYLVKNKDYSNLKERITTTNSALKSIRSILEIISDLKQLKYTFDPVEITVILDNIKALNRLKTYDVSKVEIREKEKLEGLYLGNNLSEGHLFNSILTLINNSNEAHATKIVITPENPKDGKIALFITDNGRGILNSKGEIEKNLSKVFSYGYSTKTDKSVMKKVSVFKKFILTIFGDSNAIITSRGAGLSIAKKVLNRHGGDLEISNTSPHGTIFKVTLPVVKLPQGVLEWPSLNQESKQRN